MKQLTVLTHKGHNSYDFDPTKETDVKKIKDIVWEGLKRGDIFYLKEQGKGKDLVKVGGKELTIKEVESNLEKVVKIIVSEENIIIGLKPSHAGG